MNYKADANFLSLRQKKCYHCWGLLSDSTCFLHAKRKMTTVRTMMAVAVAVVVVVDVADIAIVVVQQLVRQVAIMAIVQEVAALCVQHHAKELS